MFGCGEEDCRRIRLLVILLSFDFNSVSDATGSLRRPCIPRCRLSRRRLLIRLNLRLNLVTATTTIEKQAKKEQKDEPTRSKNRADLATNQWRSAVARLRAYRRDRI